MLGGSSRRALAGQLKVSTAHKALLLRVRPDEVQRDNFMIDYVTDPESPELAMLIQFDYGTLNLRRALRPLSLSPGSARSTETILQRMGVTATCTPYRHDAINSLRS
jgi:hypothetical protein